MCNIYLQLAKILLLPPKYEIIMLSFNHSFFQYCDSNIGLFSIAPCKVIDSNSLCNRETSNIAICNIGKITIFKGEQKLFRTLMVAIIFSPTVYQP